MKSCREIRMDWTGGRAMDFTTQEVRSAIADLCRRRRVQTLELFGSATGTTFDSATSDLDFLVRFQPMPTADYADCYFGLREDLESLFARAVDLVETAPLRNPYFLKAIESTRVLLYAA
jgi:predicted nucleotidyltransferase